MPRTERPIDTDTPLAVFARDLRAVRHAAGLTYREMSLRVHYSATALSIAANGKKIPTWDCTRAYLQACGVVDPASIQEWKRRLKGLRDEHEREKQINRALPRGRAASPLGRAISRLETVTAEDIARAAGLPPPRPRDVDATDVSAPDSVQMQAIRSMEEFAAALDQLRRARQTSIRQLAHKSRSAEFDKRRPGEVEYTVKELKKSTISDVLNGRRKRIDRGFLLRYLRTCGVEPASTEEQMWLTAWERVHRTAEYERTLRDLSKLMGWPTNPSTVVMPKPPVRPHRHSGTHRRQQRRVAVWLLLLLLLLSGIVLTLTVVDPF